MRRRSVLRGFPPLVFLLLGASCAATGTVLAPRGPDPAYAEAIDQATRETRILREFSTLLSLKATYRSEAFRAAYVEHYAKLFLLDPLGREALLQHEKSALASTVEFFACLWSSEDRWGNLRGDPPPWRILLEDPSGARREAVRVESVDEPLDRTQSFFPYVTPWCSRYALIFRRDDAGGKPDPALEHPRLILTGTQGTVELSW